MTREEKIAKAQRLRASGKTYPAIAAELGVVKKTVRRWLNPDEAEADRERSRQWKHQNRDRVRVYDHAYGRDHRGTCTECGGQMGVHCGDGVCKRCLSKIADARARRAVEMWHDGATMNEMAETLGCSERTLGVLMHEWRAKGYDLPYRRVGPRQPGVHAALRP